MSLARLGKEPANKVHLDERRVYELYVKERKTASEFAAFLGVTKQVIKNRLCSNGWSRSTKVSCNLPLFKEKMRILRVQRLSEARLVSPNRLEKLVYDELDRRGVQYFKQYPLYGKFVVDAFFPEQNLVLEIFGKYWHQLPKIKKKDISKRMYLERCGHIVREIWDYEIKSDLGGALDLAFS